VLLNHRLHIALAAIPNLLTVLAVIYAEAYAGYLLDSFGSRPAALFDSRVLKYGTWYELLPPFVLIYFIPTIAVVMAKKSALARIVFIALGLASLWFAVDAIGTGGDRKGCEACLIPVLFNLFVMPVVGCAMGLTALAYALLIKFKKGRLQQTT
jgi:hypothetical protein